MMIKQLGRKIDPLYTEPAYLKMIEEHLTHIRRHPETSFTTFTSQKAAMHQGHFYGLLDDIGIEKKYQYVTMRVNGLTSPEQYRGDFESIIVPAFTLVDQYTMLYRNQ